MYILLTFWLIAGGEWQNSQHPMEFATHQECMVALAHEAMDEGTKSQSPDFLTNGYVCVKKREETA